MKLIILTKKFGENFTGATVATQELLKRWIQANYFDEVYVYCKEVGEYKIEHPNLFVDKFTNFSNLKKKIDFSLNYIGYSDDHMGYYLDKLGIKYIHTYHGNWPNARYLNIEMFLKSFYFIPKYAKTLSRAGYVVNVSKYMEEFTRKYNQNTILIRNGVNSKISHIVPDFVSRKNIIMIGNLDYRKYGKLINIADYLMKVDPEISIDIFGKVIDKKLFRQLSQIGNIRIKGFEPIHQIDLNQYRLLLSTSIMENLPISMVEIMKMGIPVYALSSGGISEVVSQSNGKLFEMNNSLELAREIVDFINGNRTFEMDYSLLDEFDWDKSSERYLQLFKNYKILESKI